MSDHHESARSPDFRTRSEKCGDFLIRHFTTAAFNERHTQRRREKHAPYHQLLERFLRNCDDICASPGVDPAGLKNLRQHFALTLLRERDNDIKALFLSPLNIKGGRTLFKTLVDSGFTLTVDDRIRDLPVKPSHDHDGRSSSSKHLAGVYYGRHHVLAVPSDDFGQKARIEDLARSLGQRDGKNALIIHRSKTFYGQASDFTTLPVTITSYRRHTVPPTLTLLPPPLKTPALQT